MKNGMSEEQIYRQAEKRVAAKNGFFIHLAVYIAVNILLVLIWAFVAGAGFPWFIFPIGGWGIAIILHYLSAFASGKQSNRTVIEKEAEKIRREQNSI